MKMKLSIFELESKLAPTTMLPFIVNAIASSDPHTVHALVTDTSNAGIKVVTGNGPDVLSVSNTNGIDFRLGGGPDTAILTNDQHVLGSTGKGNDLVSLIQVKHYDINTGPGHDQVTGFVVHDGNIETSKGDDFVKLKISNETNVSTGKGNDVVVSDISNNLSIKTSKGSDFVSVNQGSNTYVNSGPGPDKVVLTNDVNLLAETGKGSDTVIAKGLDKFDIQSQGDGDRIEASHVTRGNIESGPGSDLVFVDSANRFNVDVGPGPGNTLGVSNVSNASIITGSGTNYSEANNVSAVSFNGTLNNGVMVVNNAQHTTISYASDSPNDIAINQSGSFAYHGSNFNDNVILRDVQSATLFGKAGDDRFYIEKAINDVYIEGAAGNDTFTVNIDTARGNIDVRGEAGADTLNFKGSINSVQAIRKNDFAYFLDITNTSGQTLRVGVDFATENVQFNGIAYKPVFS